MSDLEKGSPIEAEGLKPPSASDSEAAAAKLWAVYVSEAEKYDKALVESWKSDMNGMLIFAGLFSASLTAFLIESYKTLSPDSGDATVQLLAQISLQLGVSMANGSTLSAAPPPQFTAPPAALVCNALWFISLGLSLSSALVATLLDQWARDFLHRSEMRSAPVIRARVFSFLYYGLKRFNMHAVVEAIPLLLHASLLLFLAGLVAFLLPVNRIIMGVAAGLLALLVIIYCGLTILPILYLDCPYRTPVSGALWRLFNVLRPTFQPASVNVHTPTVVEAVVKSATGISDERTDRDRRALIWTVKSLADDTELEPFVESIPDVLWGPNGRRGLYDDHITTLINNPDTHLMARIIRLLQNADSGLLLPEAKARRQITCFKALWTIAPCLTHLEPDMAFLQFYGDPAVDHYALSARCQLRCNAFRLIDARVEEILADLDQFHTDVLCGRLPSLAGISQPLFRLESMTNFYLSSSPRFPQLPFFDDEFIGPTDMEDLQRYLVDTIASIRRFRADASWMILLSYFDEVSLLKTRPFEFDSTHNAVQNLPAFHASNPVSPDVVLSWCSTVNTIAVRFVGTGDDESKRWTESILETLLSLWGPDTNGNVLLPDGLIHYLNSEKSPWTSYENNRDFSLFLPAITTTLSGPREDSFKQDCLTALWYYLHPYQKDSSPQHTDIWDRALAAVLNLSSSPASHSVAALLKNIILKRLSSVLTAFGSPTTPKRTVRACFAHPLLPSETAVELPTWLADVDDTMLEYQHCIRIVDVDYTMLTEHEYQHCIRILRRWTDEAQFVGLTAFLEICNTSKKLPFEAVKTLKYNSFQPTSPIHMNHQLRFANGVHAALERDPYGELTHGIIDSSLFDVYVAEEDNKPWRSYIAMRWLDAPSALQIVRDSFTVYAENYPVDGPSNMRERVLAILQGMVDAGN
ncbi:hypothetical protein C8J57DRAFT_1130183 [Mycena rebaudengoi]|nr:hypothetical protein C8J57DRAFT_1130183 [Mycena rebaudengoi]